MSKERIFVLISFIILAFAAYRDCFDIFIPGDNYSLFYIFETEGLKGAVNNLGSCFLPLPVILLFYKFIADSSSFWITASLILHVLNAYLVYHFMYASIRHLIGKQMSLPALFSGIIFLLSPYQTEAIIWTPANFPILISTLLFLVSLILLLNYLESNRNNLLYALHAVFILAVFSYESSFVLPGISVMLFLLYKTTHKTGLSLSHFMIRVMIPQIGIIILCFLTTKILSGEWIWHGDEFGGIFSFSALGGNMLKYLAKFFIFFRYLNVGSADNIFREIFDTPVYLLLIFGIAAFLILLCFFILVKKKKNEGIFLSVLLTCFLLSLIPVLPLDSSF